MLRGVGVAQALVVVPRHAAGDPQPVLRHELVTATGPPIENGDDRVVALAHPALDPIDALAEAYGAELDLLAEYKRHDIRVTSMCVEGHVVVVAHSDVGQGGGLQMLQLQYVLKGTIVPMQCGAKEKLSYDESDSDKT